MLNRKTVPTEEKFEGEDLFLQEVMSRCPSFGSNTEALAYFSSALEALAPKENLSLDALLSTAENAVKPTALQEQALSLARQVAVLKNLK